MTNREARNWHTFSWLLKARKLRTLERTICRRFDRCCHGGRYNTKSMTLELFSMKMAGNGTYGRLNQMPPVHGFFNCAGGYIHRE